MSDKTELRRLRGELTREERRARALKAEIFALRSGLEDIREDLERVMRSRTWRWTQRAGVLRSLLRGRRVTTRGSVVRALERIDRLKAGRPRAAGAQEAQHREWNDRLTFCIKVAAPSHESAKHGGDLYFARALADELERRGHRCLVQILPDWHAPAGDMRDVCVVLRGRHLYTPQAGQFNVLWSISHPSELTPAECDGYDLVCIASQEFADVMRPRTSATVMSLEQATDPRVFFPDPSPRRTPELVFVGNSRGVRRRVLDDLLPTDRDLAVYGSGWRGLPASKHVVAEHVPYEELRLVYSSAKVVLNDHWDDMRHHGFVSNRLYDAVACGAVVISDPVDGIEDRFAGAVLTYRTRDELRTLVERLLAEPDERSKLGAAGRDAVLAQHTFAHRTDTLLDAVRDRMRAEARQ